MTGFVLALAALPVPVGGDSPCFPRLQQVEEVNLAAWEDGDGLDLAIPDSPQPSESDPGERMDMMGEAEEDAVMADSGGNASGGEHWEGGEGGGLGGGEGMVQEGQDGEVGGGEVIPDSEGEIGRASCRERV